MNTDRTMGRALALALVPLIVLAFALACMTCVAPAYAKKHFDAPTTVSDDITRLHVNKLDADTHEYVQGAKMAIIEKESGRVVDEWVTGSGTHENEKGLDVDVVYILREVEAPEGYSTVEDIEFVVNATEGTGIKILSQGADSELVESYKVNLYDKAVPTENEVVVTQTKGNQSTTSTKPAPKTGDEAPLAPIAFGVALAILGVVALEMLKRRIKD